MLLPSSFHSLIVSLAIFLASPWNSCHSSLFCKRQHLLVAATFSTLVLCKHLFVFLAPIFALHLLRYHCWVDVDVNVNNNNNNNKTCGDACTYGSTKVGGNGNDGSASGEDASDADADADADALYLTSNPSNQTIAHNNNDHNSVHTTNQLPSSPSSSSSHRSRFSILRFAQLVAIAVLFLATAFGPFVLSIRWIPLSGGGSSGSGGDGGSSGGDSSGGGLWGRVWSMNTISSPFIATAKANQERHITAARSSNSNSASSVTGKGSSSSSVNSCSNNHGGDTNRLTHNNNLPGVLAWMSCMVMGSPSSSTQPFTKTTPTSTSNHLLFAPEPWRVYQGILVNHRVHVELSLLPLQQILTRLFPFGRGTSFLSISSSVVFLFVPFVPFPVSSFSSSLLVFFSQIHLLRTLLLTDRVVCLVIIVAPQALTPDSPFPRP